MDETAFRISRHEGAHASAALSLGWTVTSVSRSAEGGNTEFKRRNAWDSRELARELGAILLIPSLIDGLGCEDDFEKLDQVVRAGTRLSQILDTASALLVDPICVGWRHVITARLGSQLSLDAEDIVGLTGD